jgi:uncharacterized protein
MYRILSLDGGGVRAVVTAVLLERLEAAYPGFLSKANLIAGTSAGGILALGLAAGLPPARQREVFEQKGQEIFYFSLLRRLGNIIIAKYSNRNLKRELIALLGDKKLGDLSKKVLIPTIDLDNNPTDPKEFRSWKPRFFHNYPGPKSDANEMCVDVALRTSAAPTLFPIHQGYIDGGIVANSPSVCALAQALDPGTGGQKLEDIVMLSVGASRNPRYITEQDADWGWAQWAVPIIELLLEEGNNSIAHFQSCQILGEHYRRLNLFLPERIDVDDATKVPRLEELAWKVDLTEIVNWLKSNW